MLLEASAQSDTENRLHILASIERDILFCAFWLHSIREDALVLGDSPVFESESFSFSPHEMSMSVFVKSK